jgi:DNA-binding sugar fermentation-stimulating protein
LPSSGEPRELEKFLVQLSDARVIKPVETNDPDFATLQKSVLEKDIEAFTDCVVKLDQKYTLLREETRILLYLKNHVINGEK